MTDELRRACAEAAHVVRPDGTTLKAGRASLHVAAGLGWRRTARLLSLPPLVWLVELGYYLVARNRSFFSRFFFRREW